LKKPDHTTDDVGHRVGRVVEAVDELEPERDQQRHAEQDVGHERGRAAAGRVDVGHQAPAGEQQAHRQQADEDDGGDGAGTVVQLRL
jgi:hypothetical protein